MNKIYFEVEEDDVVIKHIPMPEIGENIYKTEVVMTKEIFQECYNRWIEQQGNCDTCKHKYDGWDSEPCDGCCGANSKWSGESYPGEFESMEHNGRMDACMSEEISREEIAALLARGSEEMTREEAIGNLKHAIRWNDMPKKEAIEMAIKALEQEPILDKIRAEIQATIGEERTGNGNINKGVVIGLQMALDIIDKYRVESEGYANEWIGYSR